MKTLEDIIHGNYSNYGIYFERLLNSNIKKLEERPQYLWDFDYYDGPMSGLCLYNNKKCWFKCVDEIEVWSGDDCKHFRIFVVLELTDDDISEEEYWHELFRKHVGEHTDYVDGIIKENYNYKEKDDSWKKYYDKAKHRVPADYSKRKILAWYFE